MCRSNGLCPPYLGAFQNHCGHLRLHRRPLRSCRHCRQNYFRVTLPHSIRLLLVHGLGSAGVRVADVHVPVMTVVAHDGTASCVLRIVVDVNCTVVVVVAVVVVVVAVVAVVVVVVVVVVVAVDDDDG